MAAGNRSSNNPEVNRWQDSRGDYFSGTKEALIAAKICDPEWFPAKLLPKLRRDGRPHMIFGKPRMRRTYVVEGRESPTTLTHRLDAYGTEQWVVTVATSLEERSRREEERRRYSEERRRKWDEIHGKSEAEREREEEAERRKRFEAIMRTLPPLVPGSMSEAEKHHMRILRGLHDAHREHIMDMAERLLGSRGDFVEVVRSGEEQRVPPRPSKPGRALQMVVDNTRLVARRLGAEDA